MAIKQKKVKSLVAAMAYHQTRAIEATASFMPAEQNKSLTLTKENITTLIDRLTAIDIPTNHVTKLVCHDPWVSFVITLITILGVVLYVYRSCKHMTMLKGHKFASICYIHVVFCSSTRYVPLKIGQHIGSPFLFKYNLPPPVEDMYLQRQCLWDTLHIEWELERIYYKDKVIPLREHLNVPLADKFRLRWIMGQPYQVMYMVKQGDTWYNLSQTE